tara:strand:- start:484 stop:717 length:234 start_codon:yes stop_codon:yes gene_type:complete
MFGWFYSWSTSQICALIDEVDKKRKKRRIEGKTMKSSFADDLKDLLNGVEIDECNIEIKVEEDQAKQTKKKNSTSSI